MRGVQLALPVFIGMSCAPAFVPACAPTPRVATAIMQDVPVLGADVACVIFHDDLPPAEVMKACPTIARDALSTIATILSASRMRAIVQNQASQAMCAPAAK